VASNQSAWTSPLANWPPAMWRFVIVTDSTTHAPRMWQPPAYRPPSLPRHAPCPPPSIGKSHTQQLHDFQQQNLSYVTMAWFIRFSVFFSHFFRILCVLVLWALSILSFWWRPPLRNAENKFVNMTQFTAPVSTTLRLSRWPPIVIIIGRPCASDNLALVLRLSG